MGVKGKNNLACKFTPFVAMIISNKKGKANGICKYDGKRVSANDFWGKG